MGFLAPLYILGLLAIGIPIVLHLIKRTPQGRRMFSSLMFLSASPPRISKRSRLNNLLLLLLRAAALVILAFAFARPYFFSGAKADPMPSSGRRIIFLVDTSASMRRPDLWTDAKKQVETALSDVKPADEVGLYFFDRQIRPGLTLTQWNEADSATRLALFRAKLAETSPGWSATRLGDALTAAADLASASNSTATGERRMIREIVLITDNQEGANQQALMGYDWPKEVRVRKVPALAPKHAGNASLEWARSTSAMSPGTSTAPSAALLTDGLLRVNVSNQSDSTKEQFTLAWANEQGPLPGKPIDVYVAPGHSQMVRVPLPADGAVADRLVLRGDDCDFDNTLYMVPPHMETVRLAFLGDDAPTDVNASLYYLRSALFDTPLRKVDVVARKADRGLVAGDLTDTRLVVVNRPPTAADLGVLRSYVENGGDVLWVGRDLATAQRAGVLLGRELQVTEATGDYSLISRVELTHPLFAPFADARYADFTKIHFWHHRQIKWQPSAGSNELPALNVLAAFDDGDPYLLEQPLGKGTIRLMTSGWQPADSQLALSSKFLPILEEMIRRKDAVAIGAQYSVGDAITVPATARAGDARIVDPSGKATSLAEAATFAGTDRPGIYHLQISGQNIPVAVNLAPSESLTKPVPLEDLEEWGVKFTSPESVQAAIEQERILRNNELENRQKYWRWLLLGVLGLLALETALAGRLSRGAIKEGAAT
jgi:hypothetical protein